MIGVRRSRSLGLVQSDPNNVLTNTAEGNFIAHSTCRTVLLKKFRDNARPRNQNGLDPNQAQSYHFHETYLYGQCDFGQDCIMKSTTDGFSPTHVTKRPERVLRDLQTNPQQLFYSLKREVTTTNGPAYIELEGIASEVGYQAARSLCEDDEVERRNVAISYNPMIGILSIKMPTAVHDSVHWWVVQEVYGASFSGVFTQAELDDLDVISNARFDSFSPPWVKIYKKPDAGFLFTGAALRPGSHC
ncbi:hypothetical protein BDV28DRAFT_144911 [Aspergillus coremiiformis]|uniref:Uncharacterized protein n=1 Tax=Aspergillus coremiiformis TaxID=138285 RepID=A0A5N6ZGJ3_9EURO|nr:hypothetical protein BDV28DRAFT_144911 [Aspergillus coremiiformis]